MKVKAIENGFFGGFRRRQGDVFEVPEGTKARWFAPVQALGPAASASVPKDAGKGGKTAAPAGGKAKGKEPETLSEIARNPSAGQTMVQALAPEDKGDADIA